MTARDIPELLSSWLEETGYTVHRGKDGVSLMLLDDDEVIGITRHRDDELSELADLKNQADCLEALSQGRWHVEYCAIEGEPLWQPGSLRLMQDDELVHEIEPVSWTHGLRELCGWVYGCCLDSGIVEAVDE